MRFPAPLWISGLAALGTAGLLWLAASVHTHQMEARGPRQTVVSRPGEWDTDPALWGRNSPRQYESWRLSQHAASEDIGLGPGLTRWGSVRRQVDPDSGILFAGFALSKDTSANDRRHPATCLDCHAPRNGGPRNEIPRISRTLFAEAMQRRGIDVHKARLQELRTFACAQCHSTTLLSQDGATAWIPWSGKLDIESILANLDRPEGPIFEWRHGISGAPMIKLRHPEYELWSQGIHAQRGVSCADCHMPYVREGTASFSDHALKSPLLMDLLRSCGNCHHEQEQELRSRVERIQECTAALQQRAKRALIAAHEATGLCVKARIPEASLKPVHKLLREAQARWDFIASEGSAGFHAPQEAARVLGVAIDQAGQAELQARQLLKTLKPSTASKG